MITISLYGRGGQGIKTGAHVIGTAAFLSGFHVQDQPLYGAERRGAPISAYVRISKQTILDRGEIDNPSIVVIGEESLMEVSSGKPLHGLSENALVLANTSLTGEEFRSRYRVRGHLVVFDLKRLASGIIERPHLGIAVAAATCKILGLGLEKVRESIAKELDKIQIGREEVGANMELAVRVFSETPSLTFACEEYPPCESKVLEPRYHEPAVSTCAITATGNSVLRHRGQWSNFKPVIDYEKCTKCMICFVYCPDSAFTIDAKGYPLVDYDACKGCDICETECPVKVITLVERGMH